MLKIALGGSLVFRVLIKFFLNDLFISFGTGYVNECRL